jgi:hypothetical protein
MSDSRLGFYKILGNIDGNDTILMSLAKVKYTKDENTYLMLKKDTLYEELLFDLSDSYDVLEISEIEYYGDLDKEFKLEVSNYFGSASSTYISIGSVHRRLIGKSFDVTFNSGYHSIYFEFLDYNNVKIHYRKLHLDVNYGDTEIGLDDLEIILRAIRLFNMGIRKEVSSDSIRRAFHNEG